MDYVSYLIEHLTILFTNFLSANVHEHEMLEVKECGHFIQEEKPEQIARSIGQHNRKRLIKIHFTTRKGVQIEAFSLLIEYNYDRK